MAVLFSRFSLYTILGLTLIPATRANASELAETTTVAQTTTVAERAPRPEEASWTAMADRPPKEGALVHAEFGFSTLPRISIQQLVAPDVSIGALLAFDYAGYVPRAAFRSRIVVAGVARYDLDLGGVRVGLRAEPGVAILFSGGAAGLLDLSANAAANIADRFFLGGGIDMPLAATSAGGVGSFAWPLLVGPIFEAHITPPLALTVDAKFGVHLATDGIAFGMRVLSGIAYRL